MVLIFKLYLEEIIVAILFLLTQPTAKLVNCFLTLIFIDTNCFKNSNKRLVALMLFKSACNADTALFKILCLTFYLQTCVLSGLPKQWKLMGNFRKDRQFTEKTLYLGRTVCDLVSFSRHAHILSKTGCS